MCMWRSEDEGALVRAEIDPVKDCADVHCQRYGAVLSRGHLIHTRYYYERPPHLPVPSEGWRRLATAL